MNLEDENLLAEAEQKSSYIKLKTWLDNHKKDVRFGLSLVLLFLIGFGTGRSTVKTESSENSNQIQYNSTTNTTEKTEVQPKLETVEGATTGQATNTNQVSTDCIVKGNISSSGKIYHVKGGSFYDRTNPEICFKTEAEATAAGFRKSSK